MKTQFESTEALSLRFEPFINPNLQGAASRIETGDTLTCTFKAPDASTGTVTMTRDATTKIWTGSIATGSFQAGLWLFRCTSNDASGPDNQYRAVDWGTGITADIPAIKAKTDNLPAVPAAQSDVTTVGTAVATVQTTATSTLAQATLARQVLTNRQKVDEVAQTQTVYQDGHSNNTPLLVFDLLDKNAIGTGGNMAITDVHERNPH